MKIEKVMVIVFLAALSGCQFFQNDDVPEELLGVWKTSSPRYEDCSLKLDSDWVIFQNGLNTLNMNRITTVKETTEDNKTLYHIYYKDMKGQEYTLSFYYLQKADRDLIRFQHQTEIAWLKHESKPH